MKDDKEPEKKEKRKWQRENPVTDYKEDELQMGDVFDVTKEILVVHSPITSMNPDFILSDLDPQLLDNPLVTYVREQLKVIEVINIHLSNEQLQDEEWRTKTNQLLLNEVYSLVIISRPKDGRVIKAILEYIKAQGQSPAQQPMQAQEEEKPQGVIGRISQLNPFRSKKKTTKEVTEA